MKNEMDMLSMDERQRNCWLLANRGTLFVVGLCWLGMIAWELWQGRTPVFLMTMVPAIALVRYLLFRFYNARL